MLLRCLACLFVLAFSLPAAAQTSVVVLGIRSIEGDDDVAHDLTAALREAAGRVEGWTVSPAAVSMAQMALAHGCEDVDAACLADMAQGLQAQLIVYGTLRRNSARDDFDFAFALSLFDARTGAIERTLDDTIARQNVSQDALAERAQRLIARISGTAQGGAIIVRANVASGDVLINGQPVGQLTASRFQFDGLQEGNYRVEVRSQGYAPYVVTVRVGADEPTTVDALLQEGVAPGATEIGWDDHEPVRTQGGHKFEWLGWTLLGVSGASLVGTIVAWTQIASIDEDPLLQDYRDVVYRANRDQMLGVTDVCDAARDGRTFTDFGSSEVGEVESLCDSADTWELLQYVFIGTAVATGGVGTFLVLTAGDGGAEDVASSSSRSDFALTPRISPRETSLTATLRF